MTTTPNPGPTRAPGGFGIDSRIGAATTRAPAASREDYRPQAILKFQLHNSFDYRVCYEPQQSKFPKSNYFTLNLPLTCLQLANEFPTTIFSHSYEFPRTFQDFPNTSIQLLL